MFSRTFPLQIFSLLCFSLKDFIQIVRLYLAAVSINGLKQDKGVGMNVMMAKVLMFFVVRRCPPLPAPQGYTQNVTYGDGSMYGSVVEFDCLPGRATQDADRPITFCKSDGTWSSPPPRCQCKLLQVEMLISMANPVTNF